MKLRPFALLAASLFLVSCGLFSDRGVHPPATPILTAGGSWAIVKSSYVRLKDKPSAAAADLAALRDGTEVLVTGREYDASGSGVWCRVKIEEGEPAASGAETGASGAGTKTVNGQQVLSLEGWVPQDELEFFATKAQADRALKARSGK